METIAFSKFEATCLAVLEQVQRTGEPVVITRFGEPVAEVVPLSVRERPRKWLGSFRERGEILGDLISPAGSEDEWDAPKA
jgi:prevent-host-death family protein